MSSSEAQNSSEYENTCVVCFKNVDIFSIGICDHAVCFECSTRMRVLCVQNECPICRQDMPKVIFTKHVEPFNQLFPRVERSNLQDRKYGLYFCGPAIQRAYHRLLEYNCHICDEKEGRRWPFKTFQQLKDHMRREHELFFCDLCVQNLKIFPFERRCYTRSELALHKRKGDVDNKSHRGHPLCEFCDVRYMDSDELFRHLRREHLFCHFCDADGKHQYYNAQSDLRAHFLEEHFLCEEGDCKNDILTSVFRTDIDLKAHMAQVHSKHLKGAAHKQARMLDIEFTLAPRPRQERMNNRHNNTDRSDGAAGYDNYYMEPGGSGGTNKNNTFVNPLRSEDFPTLGNADAQAPPTSSIMFTSKFSSKPFSGKDFPSLGVTSRAPGLTITGKVNAVRKNDDFPSLGSSSSRAPDVTITRTVRSSSALDRNLQNFPALGENSGLGSSTVKLSLNSSGNSQDRGSKVPNVSIHVNNANGAITTRIRSEPSATVHIRPKSAVEDFPALGEATSSKPANPQWITAKSKKQPDPKSCKVAPAPSLPPSDLMDFPALSKGNNQKSTNKKSSSVQVSNSWVNLNSFNNVNKSNESKEEVVNKKQDNKNGGKSEKSKNGKMVNKNSNKNVNQNGDVNENKFVESGDSKSKGKKKRGKMSSSNNNNSGKENTRERSALDLITDQSGGDRQNWEDLADSIPEPMVNGLVKKRSELNIESLQVSDPEPMRPEDFPALGRSKPPPGFNFVKPPPGINPLLGNSNKKSNSANIILSQPRVMSGLTFTNSSGQSYSILPSTVKQYHPPPNSQVRNKNLIESFMGVVKDSEILRQFKTFSDMFREGSYPADKYYEHCQTMLGSNFDKLFPELLVLLPNILKQQELYQVHISKGPQKILEVCATCQQVILSKELRQHLMNHTLENHFPVLGTTTADVNVWKK